MSMLRRLGLSLVALALAAGVAFSQTSTNPSISGVTTAGASARANLSSGDITTASTSLVDLTGVTVTMTTGSNPVHCGFAAQFANSSASEDVVLNLAVDGVLQMGTAGLRNRGNASAGVVSGVAGFTWMTSALTSGSHTIKVQWSVSAGTGTLYANTANALGFWCREVK